MSSPLKAVDAVLGWRVFQYWDPDRIETVFLNPGEVPRIGYIPIAISRFTQDKDLANNLSISLSPLMGKPSFRSIII